MSDTQKIESRLDSIEKRLAILEQTTASSKEKMNGTECLWNTIGIAGRDISLSELSLKYASGVEITKIRPNSPPYRNKLKIGDVVVGRGEKIVKSRAELAVPAENESAARKFYVLRGANTYWVQLESE